MWRYLIDSKYLTWYQRLYLYVYDFYLTMKNKIFKGEVLIYKR